MSNPSMTRSKLSKGCVLVYYEIGREDINKLIALTHRFNWNHPLIKYIMGCDDYK